MTNRPPLTQQRAHIRRVLAYLMPYWRQWLAILACVTASVALGALLPQIVRHILDVALPRGDGRLLDLLVVAMLAVPVANGLIGVLQQYLTVKVGQAVMFDLRHHLYTHLQRLSLRFFTGRRTGEIMSRLNSDVAGINSVLTNTLVSIASNTITVVTAIGIMLVMNWQLLALAAVLVPAFVLPTQRVGAVRRRLSRQTSERQAELSAFMQETLNVSGFILVKLFGRERYEASRFQQKNLAVMALQIKQLMVGRWYFAGLGMVTAAGPALIYWYGGHRVIAHTVSVGTIIAFVAYLGQLYRPLTQLASVYVEVQGALALFDRIFEYLDTPPEIVDRPGAIVLPAVQGRVEFRDVVFEYQPGIRALDGVSFVAEPGQLVALVGPSGAGKSTLTYLVPRFYDPVAGAVLVDGHDVRDVTRASLVAQIGMVTQETFLFHASVRENLLYARAEATDDEIIAACRAAHIHHVIEALPEGYDTVVGERGFRLSGGEKQRLSIARAILKDPRILILDEATSSLDSTSEALIQQALEPLMRGRTSLVIAHRLSTVRAADKIVVLERGRVKEEGRHQELVRRGGLYARLYRQQFAEPGTRAPVPGADGEAEDAGAEVLPVEPPAAGHPVDTALASLGIPR